MTILEVTFNDEIRPWLRRFKVFLTYDGLLIGNPISEEVKVSIFGRGRKWAQSFLDGTSLSALDDYSLVEPLARYWHVAELVCLDEFDYGELEEGVDAMDVCRSYYAFDWMNEVPSFDLPPVVAERIAAFNWKEESWLQGDLHGRIYRAGESGS